MESETVDSHINQAEKGGILEERHSMVRMRVYDGGIEKIKNNKPGRSWLNMHKNKKLP